MNDKTKPFQLYRTQVHVCRNLRCKPYCQQCGTEATDNVHIEQGLKLYGNWEDGWFCTNCQPIQRKWRVSVQRNKPEIEMAHVTVMASNMGEAGQRAEQAAIDQSDDLKWESFATDVDYDNFIYRLVTEIDQ